MAARKDTSMAKTVAKMALFVVIGFPVVGFLWETLNELLALEVNTTRLLISIPVLFILIGLLYWLSRAVQEWQRANSD